MPQFSLTSHFKSLCILLICVLILPLFTACVGKDSWKEQVVFNTVEVSSTQARESEKTTERLTEAQTRETTSKETKESQPSYDFSKEYDAGNLAAYVGGSYNTYVSSENGPEVAALDTAIKNFLNARGLSSADIGIVYQDLSSGVRYSYNADQRYVAASVIKVAAAMVVAELTDEGVFPQDMQVLYVPGEQFTADNLDSSRLGQLVPIWDLVDSAIMYSDNAATSILFEYFRRHGQDLHMFMDARTGCHYAADVTMSAREGAGLIEQLYAEKRYPSYSRVLSAMSSSTWNSFLTKGIPVNVSSKYGNLGDKNHEIGLVWTERPFAYAVFTNGVAAYEVLPELGTLLYEYHIGGNLDNVNPENPVDPGTAEPEVPRPTPDNSGETSGPTSPPPLQG